MDDSSPPAAIDPIADARRQIDRVDEELLALIAQRQRLSDQLDDARLAAGAFPLRPAREIQVMRRLMAAAPTHLGADLVQEIWRALMNATVRQARGVEIAVAGGAEPGRLFDVARRHFGGSARIQRIDDPRQALSRALDQRNLVCVLPWLGKTGAGGWWPILAESRFSPLVVIGALPLRPDGAGEPDAALVAANAPLEPAGGDVTLAIAFDPRFKLQRALAEAGLEGSEIARASALVLLKMDGYLHPDDLRPAMLSKAGLDGFRVVGSYARV